MTFFTRPRIVAAVLLGALLVPSLSANSGAQTQATTRAEVAGRTVIVATKPLEPFVIVDSTNPDGSGLRGYSIDVWNEVADRLDLTTEWLVQDSVTEILDSARDGDANLAIAGISMTPERETFIDFSHPYYDSGLLVATRGGTQKSTFGAVVGVVTSKTALVLIGVLILLVTVVAHLVWWSERRHNPEFPHTYGKGIAEALWWSSVSIVAGGETVKDIRRPLSRVLALFWMVVGLFLIAFVTAQAASSLTVNRLETGITGVDDLPGNDVVTVTDTVAQAYLLDANIAADGVADIDVALELVASERYDAVVYDSPVLAYRVSTDYNGTLELAGASFAPDPYSIALTTGSDLREPINSVLLEIARDGTLDALNQKWLGTDR